MNESLVVLYFRQALEVNINRFFYGFELNVSSV